MAALLHDTMEDCGVTKADLIERFGAPVAELVDGLTKLDKLRSTPARKARPSPSARCCWPWRATCASS
jgi:(p)ppGpp synthase/HD superfamily hydrolase